MKKTILSIAFAGLFLLMNNVCQAQADLSKGNVLLNGGLGFGYYYAGGVSINFNAEFSITDEIGIGPYLGFTTWRYGYFGYRYNYTFIDFGVRGSYHFARLFNVTNDRFDPYGGIFIGYLSSSYSGPDGFDYSDPYGGAFRAGIHAGARYYFTSKFAGYGEVGVGLSPLTLGLTLKL